MNSSLRELLYGKKDLEKAVEEQVLYFFSAFTFQSTARVLTSMLMLKKTTATCDDLKKSQTLTLQKLQYHAHENVRNLATDLIKIWKEALKKGFIYSFV